MCASSLSRHVAALSFDSPTLQLNQLRQLHQLPRLTTLELQLDHDELNRVMLPAQDVSRSRQLRAQPLRDALPPRLHSLTAGFANPAAVPSACRQALDAVAALPGRLEGTAELFRQELHRELRYGVGVHCGQAIVGEVGFGQDVAFTALGETVNEAHRLQQLARDRGVAAVVSDEVYAMAEARQDVLL